MGGKASKTPKTPHPVLQWSQGLVKACAELQGSEHISASDWSRFLELIKHPNTAAMTQVLLKSVHRGEAQQANEVLSHIRSIREPILHHTDKIRDVWHENALAFKLPESLLQMHKHAARSGADPQHMGLLVMQAIAQAVVHIILLEQLSKLEIRIAGEQLNQLRVKGLLESEREGFIYAQEYANPAFLARQEALIREYLERIKGMIEERSTFSASWLEELLELNQYAAQIAQLQNRLASHVAQIEIHHVEIDRLVEEHLDAGALMRDCPQSFRAIVHALSAFMSIGHEDGFELAARVVSEEMQVQLKDGHSGVEAEEHFKIARGNTIGIVYEVLEEINEENAQANESHSDRSKDAVRARITNKISTRSFDHISEGQGLSEAQSQLARHAFECMKRGVCNELGGVKVNVQEYNLKLDKFAKVVEQEHQKMPKEHRKIEDVLGAFSSLDHLSLLEGGDEGQNDSEDSRGHSNFLDKGILSKDLNDIFDFDLDSDDEDLTESPENDIIRLR